MQNRPDNIKQFLKNTKDPNSIRSTKIEGLKKSALGDQHGAFQHFQSNVMEYATRDRYLSMRGGEPIKRDTEGLYGIGPEHEDSYMPDSEPAWHLSTRYSPDRVGVQAQRVSDGVFQDPYTNKVYDYNEGFKTEDGRQFPAGSASLQTSIMHLANHLDNKGLVKEADYLDSLLKRAANDYEPIYTANPNDPNSIDSARTMVTENRDLAHGKIGEARRLVVEANRLLIDELPDQSSTDEFYSNAQDRLKDAADALDMAQISLTGHSGKARWDIVGHPDRIMR